MLFGPSREDCLGYQEGNMADEEKKEEEKKEEAAEEKTDQEVFDEAFKEAVAEPEPAKEEVKEDKPEEEVQEEKPAEEEKKEEPKEEEKSEAQEEIDWKAKAEAAEAERAKVEQKMKSWEGRISAANKRAEDEAAARAALEKKLQERDSTQAKSGEALPGGEEDDQVLKDFVEEFPSLEKPIKALARRIASKIVDDKIKDIEPKITQVAKKIEPIEQSIKQSNDDAHFETIGKAHSDWKDIVKSGKLTEWIETQPKIMQQSLDRVVKEGSTEEVIEMFDLYKKSNTTKETSTPSRAKPSTKKAQDLLAVDSSASGNPKGKGRTDKDDFDAGWDDAIRG